LLGLFFPDCQDVVVARFPCWFDTHHTSLPSQRANSREWVQREGRGTSDKRQVVVLETCFFFWRFFFRPG
jgi:hypothetical protein